MCSTFIRAIAYKDGSVIPLSQVMQEIDKQTNEPL